MVHGPTRQSLNVLRCILLFNTEVCPNQLQSENENEFWHHIYAYVYFQKMKNHGLVLEEHVVCRSQA